MSETSFPVKKTIEISSSTISYLEWESTGKAIFFLSATGLSPWLWKPVADGLWPDYRIIAPFLCGYRDADPHHGGLNWYEVAADVKSLLDRLGLAASFLVGHSMGGAVAVIGEGSFNLQARAMVLIEPILLPREIYRINLTVEQHPLAAKSIRRTNHWASREEAWKYMDVSSLFRNWEREVKELYLQHDMAINDAGLTLACHPRMEAAIFMGGVQYDPWDDLSKVKCPLLVVEGADSANSQFVDLKQVVAAAPAGKYHMVPKAGHLLPMEKPALTAEIIRSFFAGEGEAPPDKGGPA